MEGDETEGGEKSEWKWANNNILFEEFDHKSTIHSRPLLIRTLII